VVLHNSPLVDVGYDARSEVYVRKGPHVAPHNLYSSTPELYSFTPDDAVPPPALFEYRKPTDVASTSATPVGSMHIEWGGGAGNAPVDWTWNAGAGVFNRDQKGSPHVDDNDVQVGAQNVVVEIVRYENTGYIDPSGAPVPEAKLV